MNGLLLIALFLSGAAVYALLTDTLVMRGTFRKSDHPKLFWFGTIFYAATGLIAFILYLQISR
jgi:Trk-type K+ transport system membrane component